MTLCPDECSPIRGWPSMQADGSSPQAVTFRDYFLTLESVDGPIRGVQVRGQISEYVNHFRFRLKDDKAELFDS